MHEQVVTSPFHQSDATSPPCHPIRCLQTSNLADYAAFWGAFSLLCTHYSRALRTRTSNSYAWLRATDAELDAQESALLIHARGGTLLT